mgnify:CR=1 FL=1
MDKEMRKFLSGICIGMAADIWTFGIILGSKPSKEAIILSIILFIIGYLLWRTPKSYSNRIKRGRRKR